MVKIEVASSLVVAANDDGLFNFKAPDNLQILERVAWSRSISDWANWCQMFNLQRESYRRKEASWLKNEDKIDVERYDCPGTYIEVKAQPFEKLVELCTRQESRALQIMINQ